MSVVVAKGKAMAADSRGTMGSRIIPGNHNKILRARGVLIGCAGWYGLHELIDPKEWGEKDLRTRVRVLYSDFREATPSDNSDDTVPYELLVLNSHGLFFIDTTIVPIESGMWAIGSGSEFALGAAECLDGDDEAVVEEAAYLACKYDNGCSPPIHVHTL